MIVSMVYGVVIILWLIVGVIIGIMAGLTWHFHERFFSPAWMIILGPLGLFVWRWMEKREGKPRGKR